MKKMIGLVVALVAVPALLHAQTARGTADFEDGDVAPARLIIRGDAAIALWNAMTDVEAGVGRLLTSKNGKNAFCQRETNGGPETTVCSIVFADIANGVAGYRDTNVCAGHGYEAARCLAAIAAKIPEQRRAPKDKDAIALFQRVAAESGNDVQWANNAKDELTLYVVSYIERATGQPAPARGVDYESARKLADALYHIRGMPPPLVATYVDLVTEAEGNPAKWNEIPGRGLVNVMKVVLANY